jgi:sugar phosphate permease
MSNPRRSTITDEAPGIYVSSIEDEVHHDFLTGVRLIEQITDEEPLFGNSGILSRRSSGDAALTLFPNPEDIHVPHTKEEEKRLVRKIDLIIIPCLSVCYAFFYIDKTTLSYAAIFGIREDLHLVGNQYNWLSSMFYFGFLVWAFPTNLLMQRLPIGKYLGFNIFLWGILLIAQAGAKNFITLAIIRALSGAAEACADPAFILITSMWYTRRQQPIRIGFWYTANGFGMWLV